MLDEADFIARYDKHDALGVIGRQPEQLRQQYDPIALKDGEIRQMVVAGMGGSALAGEFVQQWLADRLAVPVLVVRDYALPAYVGPSTLVVASSYSGNTEETLAALDEAERRGAQIVVMSAGGKLLEAAKAKGYPRLVLPAGVQPRLTVLYGARALAQLLEAAGLAQGLVAELEETGAWLKEHAAAWGPEVPTERNVAKQMAQALVGHAVVVYGGPVLALAAHKWKIGFNETAKNLAFYYYFSEFNHNEFQGWLHPEGTGLKVIELRSSLDDVRIQRRFEVSNRLLSDRFAPIEVQAAGETKLEQLGWTLILGDFVSAYLACLNQVDPTPVDLIEQLKREL